VVNKRVIPVLSVTILLVCSLGAGLLYRQQRTLQSIIKVGSPKVIYTNIHGSISGYYIDLSQRKFLHVDYTFDDNGIPLFTTGGSTYYHPEIISDFALGAYEHYLKTKDETAKEKFLLCADWLKDNLTRRGNFYYWEYHTLKGPWFPGQVEGLPWVSAIAQGSGASVLVRAFSLTGKASYLEMARNAIIPIFYDLSVGGVSVVKGENYIFPQEYPTDPPSNVLNGAIGAYLGVHDYDRATNDPEVKMIDDKILKTFRDTVVRYDTGYWSLYSERPAMLASAHYQLLHVQLLRILYSISGDEKFREFAEKFERQSQNSMNQTKYLLANYLRQIRNFTPRDIKKLPRRLEMVLKGEVD
jgi:heparosan-N-sulfate-glucuronate 5-epimerase